MKESSKKIDDECSSDECESWDEEELKGQDYVSLAYKIKCVKMAKAHPEWSLETLQRHGCKLLKKMDWLPLWEADCEKGGNAFDKYRIINEWTWDNVVRARKRNLPIKGRHIRQWALAVAAQYPDLRFGASFKWLQTFQQKYQIQLRPTPSSLHSKFAE